MTNVRHVSLVVCLVVPALAAAQSDPDVLFYSTRHAALTSVIGISSEDYARLLRDREFDVSVESQVPQYTLAAEANDAMALGIIGTAADDVDITGHRVVVLLNPRDVNGLTQATSFAVVHGALNGVASKAWTKLELHFAGTSTSCAREYRGCSLLPSVDQRPLPYLSNDTRGIAPPVGVRIDAETPSLPTNALGHTIEVWALPTADDATTFWPDVAQGGFIGNRYACAEPLFEAASANCDETATGEQISLSGPSFSLGGDVALITERDYVAAVASGALNGFEPSQSQVEQAARIATALNEPTARGISANVVEAPAVDANVLIVARTPHVSGDVLTAGRFFVVPGPIQLSTPTKLTGRQLAILGIPDEYLYLDVCGSLAMPGIDPLPHPQPTFSFNQSQGNYGLERIQAGMPRTTVRWPVEFRGQLSQHVLGCSQLGPPVFRQPPWTPGKLTLESCNGLDDNNDGAIDEGGVCANALQCTGACTPPVDICGGRSAVSIPDGCGSVVSCP